MLKIRMTGDKELNRKLDRLAKESPKMALDAMRQGANIMAEAMRNKAPGGGSGSIGSNIRVEVD